MSVKFSVFLSTEKEIGFLSIDFMLGSDFISSLFFTYDDAR